MFHLTDFAFCLGLAVLLAWTYLGAAPEARVRIEDEAIRHVSGDDLTLF